MVSGFLGRGPILGLILVMLVWSVISFIPSASAEMWQVSGISDPLQPGEVFSVNVTIEDSGSLIMWSWDASRTDSILFWLETPNNNTYTFDPESYGVPQSYGFLAYQTGIYTLSWQNGHDLFPSTISFIITTTLPRIHLIAPESGRVVASTEQIVHGVCNGFAFVEMIGDNATLVALVSEWDPINNNTNWTVHLTLTPGWNDFWIRATYSSGDFTYIKVESYRLYMDTLWFYNDQGEARFGIGTVIVAVASVLALSGVTLLIVRRMKQRRT